MSLLQRETLQFEAQIERQWAYFALQYVALVRFWDSLNTVIVDFLKGWSTCVLHRTLLADGGIKKCSEPLTCKEIPDLSHTPSDQVERLPLISSLHASKPSAFSLVQRRIPRRSNSFKIETALTNQGWGPLLFACIFEWYWIYRHYNQSRSTLREISAPEVSIKALMLMSSDMLVPLLTRNNESEPDLIGFGEITFWLALNPETF